MRPLLVSDTDAGQGAARATYRLHTAFRDGAIDSTMLVRRKHSSDPTVVGAANSVASMLSRLRPPIERRLPLIQRGTDAAHRSANLLPSRTSRTINHSGADVVNLHWIGNGSMSISDVARIRPPVVMTLHDMWAFSGAEHYGSEAPSARWRGGYRPTNRSPGEQGPDVDRRTWERKLRHWRSMPIVCPSRWLATCVAESALMAGWPVHVIPNPLDLEVFAPTDQPRARQELGLPPDGRLVLFGALDLTDPRKGFDLLIEALTHVGADSVTGVVFGPREPAEPPPVGIPLHWTGPIADERVLAKLYGACDVVVVPSRQENLVQTGTEAQACGTPVVAFDATGLPEVVTHRETGYLAEAYSPVALAAGIDWVLADDSRRAALGRAARERALRTWDARVVVNRYLGVYEDAIADHAS